jgi:AraC-like DNA-binding protein
MLKRVSKIREGFPGQRLVVLPPSVLARAAVLPICRKLSVTCIGRFDTAFHHFVERTHGTEDYILIGCLAGAGDIKINRKSWQMREGDIAILPPATYHQYEADLQSPWTIIWAHFNGESVSEYCQGIGITSVERRLWVENMQRIVDAFEETYSYVLGGYTDSDLIGLSTSFGRLLGLCRVQQRSRHAPQRHAEEQVLRAIQFMRDNIKRPLDLRECARRAGWSPSHFSQMFKRQTNISPMEFFARLKMTRACELLTTTDSPVKQISNELGFEDPFYFSRLFRNRLHLAPSSYRNTYALRPHRGR